MTVHHRYDLTCPLCYVSQDRDEALENGGIDIIAEPFRTHPDVPSERIPIGPRNGPMYDRLNAEAKRLGLPLNWPPRLLSSRRALGVAE